jgi:magnesium-transporting ATPase (P-type)
MKDFDEDDLKTLIGDLVQHQSSDNITMEAMKAYFAETSAGSRQRILSVSHQNINTAEPNMTTGILSWAHRNIVLGDGFDRYAENYIEVSVQGYRVLAFAFTKCCA